MGELVFHAMKFSHIAWLLSIFGFLLAGCSSRYEFSGTLLDDPQPAAEIAGTNYDNSTFRLSDHRGKVVLVFFGYTFCPDICPLTLAEMKSLYQDLREEEAVNLEFVFVSVDPERDTLERLSQYIPFFHPDFHGVRVERDALEPLKEHYWLSAEKIAHGKGEHTEHYTVMHNSSIYVIDKQGDLRGLIKYDLGAEQLLSDIRYFLREK
jgi:protein SCO1